MGIVEMALSQEGVREIGLNGVPYNDWYYGRKIIGGAYPWCAVFVSWCAWKAGVPESVIPKTASVQVLLDFYRKQNRFMYKGGGYRPRPGDIMIQQEAGISSHTGIVYNSDGNKFYTIEGNTSDKVARREYKYDSNRLTGFGVPAYNGNMGNNPVPRGWAINDYGYNTGAGGPIGQSFNIGDYDMTEYEVKNGETLNDIALKFGTTPALIQFINDLKTNEVKPGQKLKIETIKKDDKIRDKTVINVGSIAKKHTKKVEVSRPTIQVDFYTESGMLSTITTENIKDGDLDKDLISLSTTRNMSQDCPTFSLSLVNRNNWYTNLSSNDLVIIKMQRPPEKMLTVFVGLIDDIRKVTDFSSGQPQRAIQVTGRGLNKALLNFEVGVVENVSVNVGIGWFPNQLNLTALSSYGAIKVLLESFIDKTLKYTFSNGKTFSDYFEYIGGEKEGEKLVDVTRYAEYTGSLWNFIKTISNPPFNETFWEMVHGKPALIHRPTPFSKSAWTSLSRTLIQDFDIVGDSTGRSDLETYTLYSVKSGFLELNYFEYAFPLWYPPYYSKYGLRHLQVSTIYHLDSSPEQFFLELFNYNIKNNVFTNGNITVKGKAIYRVGERVITEHDNMEYYVESVTHNFNCYGAWTTTLGVTRGIQPENRFTPPWDLAEDFTPDILAQLNQQAGGGEYIPPDYSQFFQQGIGNFNNFGNGPTAGINIGLGGAGTIQQLVGQGVPLPTGDKATNEKTCYNYFTKVMGLSKAVACGILANIQAESDFDHTTLGDTDLSSPSFGLVQLREGRLADMKNWCNSNRLNYQTVEGQLKYIDYELNRDFQKMLAKFKSLPNTPDGAYQAAYEWCVKYERPKNMDTKGKLRGVKARDDFWRRFSYGEE